MGVVGFGISRLETSVEKTLSKEGKGKRTSRKGASAGVYLYCRDRREIVGGLGTRGSERVGE